MHTCEWCDRTREDVEYLMDPFLYEVYGDRAFSWFCDDCYWNRKMDI